MKNTTLFIMLLVFFLTGCTTMNITPRGSKQIDMVVKDKSGNPYTEVSLATDVGFGWDDHTKVVKIFKVDRYGYVILEDGHPVIDKIDYYQLTKGGTWGLVTTQVVNAAIMATTFGTMGRNCLGCGRGGGGGGSSGGTQIINNPQSFSEAEALSNSGASGHTDVSVGCPTGNC